MNARYTVVIVIINFRSYEMTLRCLEALYPQASALDGCRVVVVDNASGDDSPDRIDQAIIECGWGDQIELVRSSVNGGFSAGNNIGIRHAEADYYLLLNSDTLVRDGGGRSVVGRHEQESSSRDGRPQARMAR